jgi:hypothetical protein
MYYDSLVFHISLILRKLSRMAPAETSDPNCDFFQGKEAPSGQRGRDFSAYCIPIGNK